MSNETPMQDDLKGDHDGPEQTFRDTERNLRSRIEALEAKLAEKDALLRECGDGVTKGDKRAATELMVGPKVAGGDGQTYVLRTPSYSEASEAFARHRATAFAAGRAARDREIVEWLRERAAEYRRLHLTFQAVECDNIADAIERGEV